MSHVSKHWFYGNQDIMSYKNILKRFTIKIENSEN